MANIIKIPSKNIYQKSTNEIENNKIVAVETVANDIKLKSEIKNVFETDEKVTNMVASKVGDSFKPLYFSIYTNTLSEDSYGADTFSTIASGSASLRRMNYSNELNISLNFYTLEYGLPNTLLTFKDQPNTRLINSLSSTLYFVSNGEQFTTLKIDDNGIFYINSRIDLPNGRTVLVYNNSTDSWIDNKYKTIDFDGIRPTVANRDFAYWIEDNIERTSTTGYVTESIEEFDKIFIENKYIYFGLDTKSYPVLDLEERLFIYGRYGTAIIYLHENTYTNSRILNSLSSYYNIDNIQTTQKEGYEAQYAWCGLYHQYSSFSIEIPKTFDNDIIKNILQYPDIDITCYGKHSVFDAYFSAKLKSDADRLGEGVYTIKDITLGTLLEEEEFVSTLSEDNENYENNYNLSTFTKSDQNTGGEQLEVKLKLPRLETIKSSLVVEQNDNFNYSVKLLTAVIKGYGHLYADEGMQEDDFSNSTLGRLPENLTANREGFIDIFQISRVEFSFEGNVLVLDVKEKILTYGNEDKYNYSINKNELIQTTTTYNGENLIEKQSKAIVNSYGNGKEPATLTCGIAKYYEEGNDSNLLIDPEASGNLPMVIPNNSIIVPYVSAVDENGKVVDKPLSTDKYGNAKSFLVIGREFSYDGLTRQILHIIEYETLAPINPYLTPPLIFLDGSLLNIRSTSEIAEEFEIIVDGFVRKTVTAPKRTTYETMLL